MKKIGSVVILLLCLGASVSSCQKKYPENKFGSFKRPSNRLCGGKVWELEDYFMNDERQILYDGQYYKQTYSETCFGSETKCNSGVLIVESLLFSPGLSYYWYLSDDEETFTTVEAGEAITPTTPKKKILKLTKNEFWYVYTDTNGQKHEFHLTRKHTFGK
ncbi:MAG: hypothetical protein RLZ33_2512 [Bacteroidota bacterium]|jgi:hypothetical protein